MSCPKLTISDNKKPQELVIQRLKLCIKNSTH